MYYSPHEGLHACRYGDCEHAHGLAQGKLDNTGHEVIDLPRSAYHEVKPFQYYEPSGFLFSPTVPTWSQQRYAAHLAWRYGNLVAAQAVDPRAFVRITVC
jgi:hypothetical protein